MAERYAINSGSIDVAANWDGGVSVPTSADDVFLNNKAMTAAAGADVTWLSLQNGAGVTAVAGGTLTITGARNFFIANITPRRDAVAIANGMVQITASSGTVAITGNVNSGSTSNSTSYCINRSGNCDFVLNGSISSQSSPAFTINMAGTGAVTFGSVGTPITIAAAVSALIQINNSSIVCNIWADKFQGGTGTCLTISAHSITNTFGPAYGGSASGVYGINSNAASGTHTHVGDCYAGSGGATPAGISKGNSGALIVTGKAISNATGNGVGNAILGNLGTMTWTGDIELGPSVPITLGFGTYVLNLGTITRVTNSAVAAMASGGGTVTVNSSNEIGCGTVLGSVGFAMSSGNATLNVPSVRGGSASSTIGASVSTGTLTINGDVYGGEGSSSHGASLTGVGTLIVNGKAIGNSYGPGTTALGQSSGINGISAGTAKVREVVSGANGMSGAQGSVFMTSDPLNKATYRQTAGGSTVVLVPATGGLGFVRSMNGGFED